MTVFLLLLVLFVQTPAPRGNVESGKALFAKTGCYQCHGREGQGATATGPRLNQNPITYSRFLSYIRKPTGDMPPYTARVLSDQQVADIFAFVQSLPKPAAVESIPLLK
jgi:ubiquinol-cytochrome c reductase cytochrome c subunit